MFPVAIYNHRERILSDHLLLDYIFLGYTEPKILMQFLSFMKKTMRFSDFLWEAWCVISLVGIWPRYIEPNMLLTSRMNVKLLNLPQGLHGLKIVQFSDLHFHAGLPDFFLKKITRKIKAEEPDLIVFTGDFLCHARLSDKDRLLKFLNSLSAPSGCFAVFGNHDYEQSICVNAEGEYDVNQNEDGSSLILQGFQRLLTTTKLAKKATARAKALSEHLELAALLKQTPFVLLNNSTKCVPIKGAALNLSGLAEYSLGKIEIQSAFQNYDPHYPGIILLHNPDGIPLLKDAPGEIILSGHTHGGQVNLPWMWKKFTPMENREFKKGAIEWNGKWVYVNRGIGSVMPFRWFAPPELLLLTLEEENETSQS